jgi:hypothetical protein
MMRPDSDSTPNRSFAAWLRLAKPIPATFGEEPVMVLDIGPSGALLLGQRGYPLGFEQELAFRDRDGNVSVPALVTGVEDHGESPHRDLLVRFRASGHGLTEFLDSYQQQIHRAEVANAEGDIAHNVIDGDRMLSDLGSAARSNEPYLRCRLLNGVWRHQITLERGQPPDGFTISAAEADEQVSLLQLAYEESDNDGRNALREFAAVSLPPT